jgi:hypothetical protein
VLKRPSPAVEPPPDLEERTITAVLQAATVAGQAPGKASKPRDREAAPKVIRLPLRTWRARLLTAAAVATAIAAAVIVPLSLGSAASSRPVAAEFSLQALTRTVPAWGQATVYEEPNGFKIVFHPHELPPLTPARTTGAFTSVRRTAKADLA